MVEKAPPSLNIFLLAMINVAAICSLKNWPLTAEYGFSSLFFFILTSLFFFIPVSLVSAELATGWPERGGVYIWVKEAFGHKIGFLAIWLQWIENVVWYPTILSFIAGTLAFSFNPKLANNTLYLFSVILSAFWGATLLNLRGMKLSGWISTAGVLLGTIIPGVLIIVLGLSWFIQGNPSHITCSWKTFFPDLTHPTQLTFLAGVLLGLAGMEMSAVHAREVKNPQRDYPRAILLSTVIIITLSVLGTLAISIVIPQKEINLVAGGIEAIAFFLKAYRLEWAISPTSILITVGAIGAMSTWTAGPSKGLLAVAQDGDLPPFLRRINKREMPVGMLILQGGIVSALSVIFLLMPDVNSSFWILLALASQLYLIMYIIMFVAAIKLRYTHPHIIRPYSIPGKKQVGMWVVAGGGLIGSLFAIVVGFLPPDQLDTGSVLFYELFLVLGCALLCLAPFFILLFKRPSWSESVQEKNSTN